MRQPVVIGIVAAVALLAAVAGVMLLQRGHQAEHAMSMALMIMW